MSKFYDKYKHLFEDDNTNNFPIRSKPILSDYNIMSFNTLQKPNHQK